MKWYKRQLELMSRGKGLYPFTQQIQRCIDELNIQEGMCYLFIPHTSASLVISESYDPTAKIDIEKHFERNVPEGQPWYEHTLEGRDDSPSHIRAALTSTSITIPIDEHHLSLGTWQGVYLFEHRTRPHQRKILLRFLEVE